MKRVEALNYITGVMGMDVLKAKKLGTEALLKKVNTHMASVPVAQMTPVKVSGHRGRKSIDTMYTLVNSAGKTLKHFSKDLVVFNGEPIKFERRNKIYMRKTENAIGKVKVALESKGIDCRVVRVGEFDLVSRPVVRESDFGVVDTFFNNMGKGFRGKRK